MKSVVITGANGFIGCALAKDYLRRGVGVYAVVRPSAVVPDDLHDAEIIRCDSSDYLKLPDMMIGCSANLFYHFAWAGTSGPERSDEMIQISNIKSTCDAVYAAAAIGCKRFIYPSSIMQYELQLQVKSSSVPHSSIYSAAKKAADDMARCVASSVGIEYVSGLISNIYGPGETSPRLVNSTIRKLLRGEHTAFSSGLQKYDFIYISDAVDLFILIGEKGLPGKEYYIGNSRQRPLKDFLYEIRGIVSPETTIGIGELPYSGPSLTYMEFDTDSAIRDLGFAPKVSFSDGIRSTMEWIIEQEGKNNV